MHHRVESTVAEALCSGTFGGPRWFVRSVRAQTRDEFQRSLAFVLQALSSTPHERPHDKKEEVTKLIGPMQGRLEPGESTSPFDSHCVKCGRVVTTTPARLVAGVLKHAGSNRLFLADRGEVVPRLDDYAQQLATRDQRARRAARQRMRAIAARGGEQAALLSLWQSLSPRMRRTLVSLSDPAAVDSMISFLLHDMAEWCRKHPESARSLGLPVVSSDSPR